RTGLILINYTPEFSCVGLSPLSAGSGSTAFGLRSRRRWVTGRSWMGVRIVALVMVALCAAACTAPAAGAQGARTIAKAQNIKSGALMRGSMFDRVLASGFSVAYWNAPLLKGDRITIVTRAAGIPPCQILYMPGTDDLNVEGQPPVLEPA